jgi:hypothetical protein
MGRLNVECMFYSIGYNRLRIQVQESTPKGSMVQQMGHLGVGCVFCSMGYGRLRIRVQGGAPKGSAYYCLRHPRSQNI